MSGDILAWEQLPEEEAVGLHSFGWEGVHVARPSVGRLREGIRGGYHGKPLDGNVRSPTKPTFLWCASCAGVPLYFPIGKCKVQWAHLPGSHARLPFAEGPEGHPKETLGSLDIALGLGSLLWASFRISRYPMRNQWNGKASRWEGSRHAGSGQPALGGRS